MSDDAKIAHWQKRFTSFPNAFAGLQYGRAALWSGWQSAYQPRDIAKSLGLVTLEATPLGMALDAGSLKHELDSDFGSAWCPQKRAVWVDLSRRFAAAVQGKLTVLLNFEKYGGGETMLSKSNPESIVFTEIMDTDYGDPRKFNHNVTDIIILMMRGYDVHNANMLLSAPMQ